MAKQAKGLRAVLQTITDLRAERNAAVRDLVKASAALTEATERYDSMFAYAKSRGMLDRE